MERQYAQTLNDAEQKKQAIQLKNEIRSFKQIQQDQKLTYLEKK